MYPRGRLDAEIDLGRRRLYISESIGQSGFGNCRRAKKAGWKRFFLTLGGFLFHGKVKLWPKLRAWIKF